MSSIVINLVDQLLFQVVNLRLAHEDELLHGIDLDPLRVDGGEIGGDVLTRGELSLLHCGCWGLDSVWLPHDRGLLVILEVGIVLPPDRIGGYCRRVLFF